MGPLTDNKTLFRSFGGCLVAFVIGFVLLIVAVIVLLTVTHYSEPEEFTSTLPNGYIVWTIHGTEQTLISSEHVQIFPLESNMLKWTEITKIKRVAIANDRHVLFETWVLDSKPEILRYYILDTAPASTLSHIEALRAYPTVEDVLKEWQDLCDCEPTWMRPWHLPSKIRLFG